MARYLLVTWDAAGGVMPMLGVAARLAGRGHDVRLLAHRSIDERCGSHGWRFLPLRETPDCDCTAVTDVSVEMEVLARDLWFNPAVGVDIETELQRGTADAVVVDCMLFGGLSAAVATGLPTAALFHQSYSTFATLLDAGVDVVNSGRVERGQRPVRHLAEVYEECGLCIVAVPREFEDNPDVPPQVRWVGPIFDGPTLASHVDRLPELGDGPVVLISLSTSYQGQLPVLQRLLEAVSELPVQAIVTTGPAVAPGVLTLPDNALAVGYIPHGLVLPRTDLMVTHAGLGSVMAALSHGVPLLCVPMGRDQFWNAARVETLGTGSTVSMDADAETMRKAITDVLSADSARAAAGRLASLFVPYRGADAAADSLEELVAT